MQTMHTQIYRRPFTGFDDFFFDLLAHFCNHLLDTGRVDTSVGHQLMQCQSGDFAAYRIERRKYDSFGGIVYDDLYTGSGFQCPDITTLTTDDTTLYFVGVDMEHGHGIFNRRFGRYTLYALYHDPLGFFVRRHFRIVHDVVDIRCGFRLRFVFERLHEFLFRLFGRQAGKVFQPFHFGFMQFIQFLFLAFYRFQLRIEIGTCGFGFAFLAQDFLLLLVQLCFTLFQPSLSLLQFGIPSRSLLLHFRLQMQEFFFDFEQFVFTDYLRLFFCFFQNRFGPSAKQGTIQ